MYYSVISRSMYRYYQLRITASTRKTVQFQDQISSPVDFNPGSAAGVPRARGARPLFLREAEPNREPQTAGTWI